MKVNIASLVIGLSLLGGCKSDYDAPCRTKVVQITHKFTTDQLAKIPYGSSDTLVFVSDGGDSLLLLTQLFKDDFTYLPTVVEGNPECPPDADAFQMIQVNLFDSAKAVSVQNLVLKQNDSCGYVVAGKKYGMAIAQIGNPDHAPYADSLVVNQKVYYSVSTFYGLGGDSILLTPTEGIIYFVTGGKRYGLSSFNGK